MSAFASLLPVFQIEEKSDLSSFKGISPFAHKLIEFFNGADCAFRVSFRNLFQIGGKLPEIIRVIFPGKRLPGLGGIKLGYPSVLSGNLLFQIALF